MLNCPNCGKEVSELDEKCPYCYIKFDDIIDETQKNDEVLEEQRNNAKWLNIFSYINIILSIIGALGIWFSSSEITEEINLMGVIGGIAILIVGFTQFFLLQTIKDIYEKLK